VDGQTAVRLEAWRQEQMFQLAGNFADISHSLASSLMSITHTITYMYGQLVVNWSQYSAKFNYPTKIRLDDDGVV